MFEKLSYYIRRVPGGNILVLGSSRFSYNFSNLSLFRTVNKLKIRKLYENWLGPKIVNNWIVEGFKLQVFANLISWRKIIIILDCVCKWEKS